MASPTRSEWLRSLGSLVLLIAVAAAAGAAFGRMWPAIAVAALAATAWQHWRLRGLLRRLTSRQRPVSPRGRGAWNELERLMHRRERESRVRKRRLIQMLRAYRAAAAALPDAVVAVDRNSQRILWFNEASGRLLGLDYPRAMHAPLAPRVAPLPLAHWLAGGRHAEPLEAPSPVDPDITLSLRLIPYSDSLWLLVARDITRLLRLERMRRDFVANVSHELRTPLTVLHGYLDMLDPGDNPEWVPMVAEMQRQSQRMAQLVEDLLMLSRLESQGALPVEEAVPMAPMLAALRREAEVLSQGRHTIGIDDRAGIDLWGSQQELHSAFSNLVGNAVRYTPTGGSVRIAFRREDGGGCVLEVQDTGHGIPAQHLPRLTERFYRVSNSRSRGTGGTGLGLAIAKHVLQLHQARLDIHSEVGRGSVFSCHFGPERVRPRASVEASA